MSALKRAWRFLGRMRVALSLLSLLLLFSALGSLLPQLPSTITDDPRHLSVWLAAARDHWGATGEYLHRWGILTFFRSPFFALLLSVVALSTIACTLNRWRIVWRQALHRPVRYPETLFTGPRTVTLPPLSLANLQDALERRGYRTQTRSEETVTYLRADRYRLSDLATSLTHLGALLLLVGYGLSGWLGWRAEITVGPTEAVDVGHGTGLAVRNDGLAVDHYPDGSVADYQAQVALLEEERVVALETVRVNGPLRFRGLGIYLMGFHQAESEMGLVLQVARDPGAEVALAGGLLLLAGVTATTHLPHRRVFARLERERALLAARSSGRDDDPGGELAALARELGGC